MGERRHLRFTWQGEPIPDIEKWAAEHGQEMVEFRVVTQMISWLPAAITVEEWCGAAPAFFFDNLLMADPPSRRTRYEAIERRQPRALPLLQPVEWLSPLHWRLPEKWTLEHLQACVDAMDTTVSALVFGDYKDRRRYLSLIREEPPNTLADVPVRIDTSLGANVVAFEV